jgi:hypothetical protein
MFAGHIGAAMALSRAERRFNIGILILAALLLDVLLWTFILLGWEHLSVPSDFSARHQLNFDFPYTHGLAASVGWSILAAALALIAIKKPKPQRIYTASIIALAVFSHWLLDAMVHQPELPLLTDAGPKIGLALWNQLPLALIVETMIGSVGLWLYLSGSNLPLWRKFPASVLALLIITATIVGMTLAPPPSDAVEAADASLITIVIIVTLFAIFDKGRVSR